MRNNILGGLVIFMVVVTCLLMIDDITNPQNSSKNYEAAEVNSSETESELAIVEREE
ncbi:hypothetical protein [Winogradskyella ursingii]|uniref:hypothetical protein n=1 Tax=Winogradskyella ursingii TaxID=2686079 RepID=UPI0015CB49B7|nr:hypothetical protein [Winogradskyella ursingii]